MDQNHDAKTDATPLVSDMARELYYYLLLDIWPGVSTIFDYGLKTREHYGALQYAVKHHGVSVAELDDVNGFGPAITALIRPGNPYYGVTFETAWDGFLRLIDSWADELPVRKFELGRLVATQFAVRSLAKTDIIHGLRRHAAGDWGNLPPEEKEANDRAMQTAGARHVVLLHGRRGLFRDMHRPGPQDDRGPPSFRGVTGEPGAGIFRPPGNFPLRSGISPRGSILAPPLGNRENRNTGLLHLMHFGIKRKLATTK